MSKCCKKNIIKENKALRLLNNSLPPHLKAQSFTKYNGATSRCIVSCDFHGNGNKWETPWIPRMSDLKTGYGCPKCSQNYRHSKNEIINSLTKTLPINLKLFDIIDYKNNNSKCLIYCNIHGSCSDWKNPWLPTINKLKNKRNCPKCSNSYIYTKEDLIDIINNTLINSGLIFNDFINFSGVNSKLSVSCFTHGNGQLWDTPWIPTPKRLKNGYGCPKCVGKYKYSENELKLKINTFLPNNLTFNKFISFSGISSKCSVTCKIHGDGKYFNTPWLPSFKSLSIGSNCPNCNIEKQELSALLLKNVLQFKSERFLYFVKFNYKNKIYYKIGLNNNIDINRRFRKGMLKNANIKMEVLSHINLPNIIACLAEYYILTTYKNKKQYFKELNIYNIDGSTECFSENLISNKPLECLINDAINNFDTIIENFSLTENEKIYAFFHFNNIKKNLIFQ